jgi:hypothetical protein
VLYVVDGKQGNAACDANCFNVFRDYCSQSVDDGQCSRVSGNHKRECQRAVAPCGSFAMVGLVLQACFCSFVGEQVALVDGDLYIRHSVLLWWWMVTGANVELYSWDL